MGVANKARGIRTSISAKNTHLQDVSASTPSLSVAPTSVPPPSTTTVVDRFSAFITRFSSPYSPASSTSSYFGSPCPDLSPPR